MSEFRVGYLYSLAPLHPGGEGDLGNILDIVREVHTNFPYVPGSSLRGCLRDEVKYSASEAVANNLFGKELDTSTGTMGIHQVWFGDARLLWIPMRTMALEGTQDAFTWVSCPTLLRDHALVSRQPVPKFPQHPVGTRVGTRSGTYYVADSEIRVEPMSNELKQAIALPAWADSLVQEVKATWETNRIVLPDSVFEVLMEHALWTQIRNKITDDQENDTESGSTEAFWTDICLPRDTILYFSWGYRKDKAVFETDHQALVQVLQGLFQVGGQANVGRGWVQGWIANNKPPANLTQTPQNLQTDAIPEPTESIGA